jgi:uncharacterized protein with HEPN domain
MRPEDADRSYLLDMQRHAEGAIKSLAGKTFAGYLADEDLRLANERRIEIIGEAAREVSSTFKDAHPEVPWRKIISQRHVLAHDYGEIEHELIWTVVQKHLPVLVAHLERLLGEAGK